MFFQDTAASSDLKKANIFCKYFFSVYSSAASVYDHPTSTTPPVYMYLEVQISFTDVHDALIKLKPTGH